MKKKWGRHLQTRDDVTIPEWLFLLLYDDKEYRRTRALPTEGKGDRNFLEFIRDKAHSVLDISGVTIDGEDLDEKLVDLVYLFEEELESDKGLKRHLATIKRYRPPAAKEKKRALKNLPEENRGAYIRYGGGL
jgi:hypothetical protein